LNHSYRYHTVFISGGSWDISQNSIRYSIRSPYAAKGFLKAIKDIFLGDLECYGISHIVYLTAVPFPMCYNDVTSKDCEGDRRGRINSNTVILNQYIVSSLLSIYNSSLYNNKSTPTLSIIDAYGIISPRLSFNQDNEVICKCHYLCKVVDDIAKYPFIHTPGGNAVLQSILDVINTSHDEIENIYA
jgi:hypothetical protein